MHKFKKYQEGGLIGKPSNMLTSVMPIADNTGFNSPILSNGNVGSGVQNQTFGQWFNKNSDNINKGLNVAAAATGGWGSEETAASTKDGITSAIGQFGPWGAAAAAALKIQDGIFKATGIGGDFADKGDAAKLGLNSSFNNAMMTIPGLEWVGSFGTTNNFTMNQELNNLGGYGQTLGKLQAADNLSGKRILGGAKMTDAFNKAKQDNLTLTNAMDDAKNLKSQDITHLHSQNQSRYSGNINTVSPIARKGFKFPELIEARNFLKSYVPKIESEIDMFQEGGKMNIIVEGALHAHNHNLKKVNPELAEEVTNKGVPVVINDSDEIKQVAEVEAGELILTKEITDKLEKLYEENSEESMIEAGKLLSEELIEYTEDLTETLLTDEN